MFFIKYTYGCLKHIGESHGDQHQDGQSEPDSEQADEGEELATPQHAPRHFQVVANHGQSSLPSVNLAAVEQPDNAARALGESLVVGDHNDGDAGIPVILLEKLHDLFACLAVQISGGFIGQ